MLPVTHLPRLSGVRVVENVKEIGDIGLAP
jgi:hypothetical protein